MTSGFPIAPTRDAGLARLAAFTPRMGRAYAGTRNADTGMDADGLRPNVSMLSAHVRHRLLLEGELAEAAVRAHGAVNAEKFLQEVCWRTYWKGWLEVRPSVWSTYLADRDHQFATLATDRALRRRHEAAVTGRTGIECFDAWATELVETGYLHNHVRMWFASIWVYTLGLPWELGADLFLSQLVDADAASNTLSWRWVVGLHTPGKTYLARRANIVEYTRGRFDPGNALAQKAPPVQGLVNPPAGALAAADAWPHHGKVGLLLCEDDLHVESQIALAQNSLARTSAGLSSIAGTVLPDRRSVTPTGPAARAFSDAALSDTLARAERLSGLAAVRLGADSLETDIADWVRTHGLSHIALMMPPEGWSKAALSAPLAAQARLGVSVVWLRRDWDAAFFPHARKGFFALREQIPETLAALGLPV